MARAFADISFTDSVRAAQTRYGSRAHMEGFERASDPRNTLREADIAFITSRDSFYQASVGENGWPYVQHRGGPAGFLRVLDARTIGYADFRGNAQYISVGNVNADERVSLILMDYPRQRRLKLWGRARIVHADDAPDVMAQLALPAYPAEVERGVLIHIDAIEWNCPQHITPRYTEAELKPMLAPLLEELQQLRAQVAQLQSTQDPKP
ncbi:pyridoxamine 5'-phosphate oxidase family protein [Viridibacterium curvum]|uniref:Pyridoxamine 5'-phosphate oxidase family protein n=1 Tax=Viridibacterium curvum TaxID=1101404 RepID=A0ABP9QUV1_9RHOO